MHQKPFLSLKTSLFQVYGNIEIVEGYSSQIYSCGKQFNLLEEYSPLGPWYLEYAVCRPYLSVNNSVCFKVICSVRRAIGLEHSFPTSQIRHSVYRSYAYLRVWLSSVPRIFITTSTRSQNHLKLHYTFK